MFTTNATKEWVNETMDVLGANAEKWRNLDLKFKINLLKLIRYDVNKEMVSWSTDVAELIGVPSTFAGSQMLVCVQLIVC